MTAPRRHRISAELLAVLAEGGGGAGAVRRLAAVDLSRRMLLLTGVAALSRQRGHAAHDLAARAYELLTAVQQQAPQAVDAVLRHPSVGVWAWRTMCASAAGQPGDPADAAGLATIAGATAIRAGFPCDLPVPVVGGTVMFPSLGQAVLGPHAGDWARLRCTASGSTVLAPGARVRLPEDLQRDAEGWAGLRAISANVGGAVIRLVIDDLDPHRMLLPTLRGRLSAEEVSDWEAGLAGAWRLLVRHHPFLAGEVSAAVRVLTPLSRSDQGQQVSATMRDAFGCVGVSSAVEPLEFAATLAHEVQHAKLYSIAAVEPLTLPSDGERYYAPWRDDPRPLTGLLQGAYAYLGVAGFWRTQRHVEGGEQQLRAHAEFARWRTAVAMVTRTLLGTGRLTRAGDAFVTRMGRVADAWCAEPVPGAAMALAQDAQRGHYLRCRAG